MPASSRPAASVAADGTDFHKEFAARQLGMGAVVTIARTIGYAFDRDGTHPP